MKAEDHSKLSVNLQKQESEIMIQGAFEAIYSQGIIEAIPLHDACYTTLGNAFRCKHELRRAFEKFNVTPSIRMKSLDRHSLD